MNKQAAVVSSEINLLPIKTKKVKDNFCVLLFSGFEEAACAA
jgi:hypothetical protein